MNVSEDELLIMIAKKNEEALGLLFSIYEKKMRYEAYNFEKICDSSYGYEDCIQDMKIQFYKLLSTYDYKKGKLYSFWIAIYKYPFLRKAEEKFNSLVVFDVETENEYILSNITYDNKYELFSIKDEMNNLKKENNLIYLILKDWANGYKYSEISKRFNISVSKVNYYVRKGLEVLKNKLK